LLSNKSGHEMHNLTKTVIDLCKTKLCSLLRLSVEKIDV